MWTRFFISIAVLANAHANLPGQDRTLLESHALCQVILQSPGLNLNVQQRTRLSGDPGQGIFLLSLQLPRFVHGAGIHQLTDLASDAGVLLPPDLSALVPEQGLLHAIAFASETGMLRLIDLVEQKLPGQLKAVRKIVSREARLKFRTLTMNSADDVAIIRQIADEGEHGIAWIVNYREENIFFVAVTHARYLALSEQLGQQVERPLALESLSGTELRVALQELKSMPTVVQILATNRTDPLLVLLNLRDFSTQEEGVLSVAPTVYQELLGWDPAGPALRTVKISDLFANGQFRSFLTEGHSLQLSDANPIVLATRHSKPAALIFWADALKNTTIQEVKRLYESSTGHSLPSEVSNRVADYQAGNSSQLARVAPGMLWTGAGFQALQAARKSLVPLLVGTDAPTQDHYVFIPVEVTP